MTHYAAIIRALSKVGRMRVSAWQAALLCLCSGGEKLEVIARAIGMTEQATRKDLSVLVRKRLVTFDKDTIAGRSYTPTKHGQEVINEILQVKKTKPTHA